MILSSFRQKLILRTLDAAFLLICQIEGPEYKWRRVSILASVAFSEPATENNSW